MVVAGSQNQHASPHVQRRRSHSRRRNKPDLRGGSSPPPNPAARSEQVARGTRMRCSVNGYRSVKPPAADTTGNAVGVALFIAAAMATSRAHRPEQRSSLPEAVMEPQMQARTGGKRSRSPEFSHNITTITATAIPRKGNAQPNHRDARGNAAGMPT